MRNMLKRRSILFTAIPLVLCVSLLIGFTLAWFTDEAVNSDNEIAAGTLRVELLKCEPLDSNYLPIGDEKLFDDSYWEPGTTKIAYLAVKNAGSLALEYNLQMIVEEGAIPLSEVMEYALLAPMSKKDASGLDDWSKISAHSSAKTAALNKGVNTLESDQAMKPGDVKYFVLALHMKNDASSRYQKAWMDLDLKVTAKQAVGEQDYFGNKYDADSEYVNGAVSSADWLNLIKDGPLGFENGLEENISVLKGTAEAADDTTRPESKKVLKINPGARVQFNQKSNTAELTVGYYKLVGYVKADDPADLSKASITIWSYKNMVNGTNIVTHSVADNILVEADENGWAYFEMMFDHGAAYSLLQIIMENGNAEGDIYFDNLEYLKYVGTVTTVNCGGSIGTILIYLTAPAVILIVGWKGVFLSSAVLGAVMLAVWHFTARDISQEEEAVCSRQKKVTAKEILSPMMVFVFLAIVLMGMLREGVTSWMPSFISESFGLENEISILCSVLLPVFSILSMKLVNLLYSRWISNPLTCAGVLFGGGALVAYLLYLCSGDNVFLSVAFSAALTGSANGVNLMLVGMIPQYFEGRGCVSTVSGMLNFFTYVGSALATYGIAALSETIGWSSTIFLWFLAALAGTVICLLCIKPWNKKFSR